MLNRTTSTTGLYVAATHGQEEDPLGILNSPLAQLQQITLEVAQLIDTTNNVYERLQPAVIERANNVHARFVQTAERLAQTGYYSEGICLLEECTKARHGITYVLDMIKLEQESSAASDETGGGQFPAPQFTAETVQANNSPEATSPLSEAYCALTDGQDHLLKAQQALKPISTQTAPQRKKQLKQGLQDLEAACTHFRAAEIKAEQVHESETKTALISALDAMKKTSKSVLAQLLAATSQDASDETQTQTQAQTAALPAHAVDNRQLAALLRELNN
ncbi:MAG: hypothetical protein V4623_03030 [Pseudomonadota bacterium]